MEFWNVRARSDPRADLVQWFEKENTFFKAKLLWMFYRENSSMRVSGGRVVFRVWLSKHPRLQRPGLLTEYSQLRAVPSPQKPVALGHVGGTVG